MATPPSTPQPLRILGVDPGLNTTGYGVLEWNGTKLVVCEAGIIRGRDRESLPLRVLDIHTGISEVLTTWKPSCVALEQLYSHYARPRTAILMGHARGVICLAASQHQLPLISYASTRIKKLLTGHGHATKQQMQLAIQRELGLAVLPEPADVADALAAAVCHYHLGIRLARTAGGTAAALLARPKRKQGAKLSPAKRPAASDSPPALKKPTQHRRAARRPVIE